MARRYRPRRFADVVGQRHVADTLRSAVARGRVGHAYLFCGPRGTGKTTLARVLAMALNCPQRTAEGEPCGVCDSCERIWAGRASLDVVEIDAASNRGVDDARELRERAQYAPSDEGRHKVYIVDEAHMLTREAWNALLKILEEPPPRVHFVFATTEPQRIQQSAPPILSRCQRFDFRRIAERELVTRLQEILSAEGVAAEEEALRLLARRADGGLRDALSALDQVLAFAVPPITVDAVRSALGWVDEEWYCALLEAIADRDAVATLRLLGRAQDEGWQILAALAGDEFTIVSDSIRVETEAETLTPNARVPASTVRGQLQARVSALAFNNTAFTELAAAIWAASLPAGFRPLGEPPELTLPEYLGQDAGGALYRVGVRGRITREMDADVLARRLRGATVEEAQAALAARDGQGAPVRVEIWPSWAPRAFRLRVQEGRVE